MNEPVRAMWRTIELRVKARRAEAGGFDGYCTDCESATSRRDGRCGCGSGRVVTSESLARPSKDEVEP